MSPSLVLLRPLLGSLTHRLRPDVALNRGRSTGWLVVGLAAYVLVFWCLIQAYAGFMRMVAGLVSLQAFADPASRSLVLELTALAVTGALAALFAINVAGSAARSLDPSREGPDLPLLLALPVTTGQVAFARALGATVLDPLGFLLLGPVLVVHALVSGDGRPGALVAALALYFLLRLLVQLGALALVLANRVAMPAFVSAGTAAALETVAVLAALAGTSGIGPAQFLADLRGSSTLVAPLAALVEGTAHLVPPPVRWALASMVPGKGWWTLGCGGALAAAVLALTWAASCFSPYRLLPRPRRNAAGRTVAWLWDALGPWCSRPAAAFLLKDVVTLWRTNNLLLRVMPFALPLGLFALYRFSPALAAVSPGVVLVPLLVLSTTVVGAGLFELAEGRTPPPMPMAPARVAATKSVTAAIAVALFVCAVLAVGFPWQRALEVLPWALVAAVLMPVLLGELLAVHPGAASEVFSAGGLRVAALWTVIAIGLALMTTDMALPNPLPYRLPLALLGLQMARGLWGRDRLLRMDGSAVDAVVMVGFLLFASRTQGVALGLATAAGAGALAPALATAALQAGLLVGAFAYARGTPGGVAALGLPPGRPFRRAVVAAAAGLGLAGILAAVWGVSRQASQTFLPIGAGALVQMLLMSGLAPLAEESFFRGVVHKALTTRFGRLRGLLASSILFAVAHGGPPSLTLLLLGLVLGLLYEWRRSVFEPAVAHMAFNHVQVVTGTLLAELERTLGL